MEQFSLEKYLENPSRKVVTRDGREVRIVFTEAQDDNYPILALVQRKTETQKEQPHLFSTHGVYEVGRESCLDLFFAEEEEKPQSIEIPFGAFDSEFIKDEYLIPEGCEARIEGNKVIIEKIQKEELTEFEKELINLVFKYKYWDSSKDKVKQGIKKDSKLLLDLARKAFPYNEDQRVAYMLGLDEGYDQAFQDFLEKAEEFLYLQLNNGSIECGNIERLIEQFKNYMQDE